MELGGQIGPQTQSDGSHAVARFGRMAELVVTELHGKYAESTYRGLVYTVAIGSVAPGTALGTAPPLALWNPPNSNRVLALVRVSLGYVSGTLGAGFVGAAVLGTQQTAAPTGGTAITATSSLAGSSFKSVATGYTGSTIGGTPVLALPVWTIGAALATTAAFPGQNVFDLEGALQVEPGGLVCLQGVAAAGTTPLVSLAIQYEEIPYP